MWTVQNSTGRVGYEAKVIHRKNIRPIYGDDDDDEMDEGEVEEGGLDNRESVAG